MSGDSETLKVYARQAADYAEMVKALENDPSLTAFITAMPEGGHVLDLGCGPGWAAARMAREGLTVTATDAVPEMVDMAGEHPGVTARQATFDDISGTAIYDGIWANFSLLHAPRADLPRHMGALARALKPGGVLHVGMKTGTGEHRDSLGRLYTYVTEDELRGLLSGAGLSPGPARTGADKGLDGTVAPWITLSAHA
ncbi:MAG: class I SAM-dependent methyltransferase [Rhodobacteraceae bacterium]|nr:class I SAM-dependent methyltransferase [Paracoccaceae bacterium]